MVEEQEQATAPLSPTSSAAAAAQKNAVEASLEKKNDISYYHAHARPREDLTDAIKITGEGLCKPDGTVEAVDENDPRFFKRELPTKRIIKLEKYMFEDGDDKVKVYLEFDSPDVLKHGTIKTDFFANGLGMDVTIELPPGIGPDAKPGSTVGIDYKFQVKNQPFHAKIYPNKSKHRISSDKTRLGITLFKVDTQEKWFQLVKKEISQHTGWE